MKTRGAAVKAGAPSPVIQKAEQKITELTAELEKPETYENPARAMTINRELISAQTTLDCLTPEWETAAGKLEELQ